MTTTPSSARSYMDLHVPLPRSDALQEGISVRQLLDRSYEAGYTTMALSHTVYGPPRPIEDAPDRVFAMAPRRVHDATERPKVLYRLHAVIENAADLALYATQRKHSAGAAARPVDQLWKEYDLISIAPRNETVFHAVCATATAAEIVTLDYTSGRGQLPFKITRSDLRAAVDRNLVFEIPLAGACLNRSLRKGLLHTCRVLKSASMGLKPRVIFSSGERVVGAEGSDAGILALRRPGDAMNLMQAVAGFDSRSVRDALTTHCGFAIDQGKCRRFGGSKAVSLLQLPLPQKRARQRTEDTRTVLVGEEPQHEAPTDDDMEKGPVVEDGFISL